MHVVQPLAIQRESKPTIMNHMSGGQAGNGPSGSRRCQITGSALQLPAAVASPVTDARHRSRLHHTPRDSVAAPHFLNTADSPKRIHGAHLPQCIAGRCEHRRRPHGATMSTSRRGHEAHCQPSISAQLSVEIATTHHTGKALHDQCWQRSRGCAVVERGGSLHDNVAA